MSTGTQLEVKSHNQGKAGGSGGWAHLAAAIQQKAAVATCPGCGGYGNVECYCDGLYFDGSDLPGPAPLWCRECWNTLEHSPRCVPW